MTNYPMPTAPRPMSTTLRMASQNFASVSPFTFQQQVLNHAGRRWELDVQLPPMKRATAAPWLAWLAQLDGSLNTFTAGDPLGRTAQGQAGGTPLVAGGSQTGSSLDVDGCPLSQADWLKAGDYIQLGTGADARLYTVTADVNSDGTGAATVPIWPSLRTSPADNAAVIVSNTVAAFRLASNSSQWTEEGASVYSLRFSGVGVV